MKLNRDEQDMLNGKEGLASQKAMELLIKYGDALGAEQFVDTNNVAVVAGLFFFPELVKKVIPSLDPDAIASKFLLDSDELVVLDRVKAFTTNHIFTINKEYLKLQGRSQLVYDLAEKMEAYCKRVGINNIATCTPYLAGNIPLKGEHCAWTESSAIPFANAVAGARTNIEGWQSSFASAITGKTPLWGMHLDENRLGDTVVDVEVDLDRVMEWGLMGYYIGKRVGPHIPIFTNIKQIPNLGMLMAFNAGISGNIIMYHIIGVTPEAHTLEMATGNRKVSESIKYGKEQRKEAYIKLNRSKKENVDIIIMGCPHYSIEQISSLARMLEGKKLYDSTALYVTTCRQTKTLADRNGYTDIIHKAGGLVLDDTCGLEFHHDMSKVIATDSAKQANYLPVENVWYGSAEDCVKAAITGKWEGKIG